MTTSFSEVLDDGDCDAYQVRLLCSAEQLHSGLMVPTKETPPLLIKDNTSLLIDGLGCLSIRSGSIGVRTAGRESRDDLWRLSGTSLIRSEMTP